jgi:uncharacterized damage-inducible protein DinB
MTPYYPGMFDGTYALLMAEYNRWMNEKLYAGCSRLTDEERKRDRGAFFKSIHRTLNHLLWGDRAWLPRFNGKTYAAGPAGVDQYDDFGALTAARAEMDGEILAWARAVSPAELAEPMTWSSKMYGFTQTQPRWVQVVQMFNHQTHHRGQVHAMLTAAGVDVGPTDVPVLPLLNPNP